jgi:hypothetical protein
MNIRRSAHHAARSRGSIANEVIEKPLILESFVDLEVLALQLRAVEVLPTKSSSCGCHLR